MKNLIDKENQKLYAALRCFLPPARLLKDPLSLLAYGTDASFYRLIPKIVIKADTPDEVIRIIQLCARHRQPLTFRGAGTSLSGQALSDSVLMMLGKGWKKISVGERGEVITLEPGVTGGEANLALSSYGRKIGPDPASLETAMIGGIAANNASGMCCGIGQNSYHTIAGMKVILADGTFLDTADRESRKRFEAERGELLRELYRLGCEVRANQPLRDKIMNKYRIKNTTGYSLNALLDFEDPFDILEHLMIGSEGTLGFIAEITYRTILEAPSRASALIYFPDLDKACSAASLLSDGSVDAVELMDRASLEAVASKTALPVLSRDAACAPMPVHRDGQTVCELSPQACALLIEIRGQNVELLEDRVSHATRKLKIQFPELEIHFSSNAAQIKKMWDVRKGLFPAVGARRPAGSSIIIEDVCFPLSHLARGAKDLRELLDQHGYSDAIIFGHALAGNLHFVFKQDWAKEGETARYGRFMEGLVHLMTERYDGSLKAEHGTGRNMAPFVEREWGREAYELMKTIKHLFDPCGVLNPGVILNKDPQSHLKNLKPMPPAHAQIDACTECGFCETVCPSKDLTLTPRQRIVVYREMKRLQEFTGERAHLKELKTRFTYAGNETCATDGLCATRCPVNIDTGQMIKTLRSEALNPVARRLGLWTARNFAFAIAASRGMLRAAEGLSRVTGPAGMEAAGFVLHRISGGALPRWRRFLPKVSRRMNAPTENSRDGKPIVVLTSCLSRTFASQGQTRPLWEVTQSLLQKAGYRAIFPRGMDGLCCGLAFESKGHHEAAAFKLKELEAALWEASEQGQVPVFLDTSPCFARFLEQTRHEWTGGLYESAGLITEILSKKLSFKRRDGEVAVHIPCSSKKHNLGEKYKAAASLCSAQVREMEISCCGFAGDKGLNIPELTASALSGLSCSIPDKTIRGISASLPCEIGLSHEGGIPFQSILYLADECSSSF